MKGHTLGVLALALTTLARSSEMPAATAQALDATCQRLMRKAKVPGASVAIVQNGRIVYARGFGVREVGKPGRVTPDTLMMIGSNGKSMTTLMMATLVDEGKLSWSTPVSQLLPSFQISDPETTKRLTIHDTVCNCIGIEKRDFELLFHSEPVTPKVMIDSLRTFKLEGEFGKTYAYSNYMFGLGGYVAAQTAGGSGDLMADYFDQMSKRVFGPIGMPSTTFSLQDALANPDHASPHGLTMAETYSLFPAKWELTLAGIAPAGASWSTVRDMSQYLLTQLNKGIAPDGHRVVSEENLLVTRRPQVEIAPGMSYGMGWLITNYHNRPMLTHGGGTLGFSSDVAMLPDDGIGVVVLANAQYANAFCAGVRNRAFELLMKEKADAEARFAANIKLEHQMVGLAGGAGRVVPLARAAAGSYVGEYTNANVGQTKVMLSGTGLMLVTGPFASQLKYLGNGEFVVWDPPIAGAKVKFVLDPRGGWKLLYSEADLGAPVIFEAKSQ